MPTSGNTLLARNGEWLIATIGDETAMMSVENGRIMGVNAMGLRVWDLIEQPRDFHGICRTLCEEFDVSTEQCADQVDAFLAEMARRGAIVRHA